MRLSALDFEKKRLHQIVEDSKAGKTKYSALWQADGNKMLAWRRRNTWGATCRNGGITPLRTKSTNWRATRPRGMPLAFSTKLQDGFSG